MSKLKEITTATNHDLAVEEMERKELLDSIFQSMGELGGSKSKQFGEMIVNQLGSACHLNKEPADMLKYVWEDIRGIAPKDPIEGMLATQMIATHYATMACFSRAAQTSSLEMRQENLNAANKLTRSYTAQMEALNRHRGKGQQKVTVEHVHVHSGGQAIVGNVAPPKRS